MAEKNQEDKSFADLDATDVNAKLFREYDIEEKIDLILRVLGIENRCRYRFKDDPIFGTQKFYGRNLEYSGDGFHIHSSCTRGQSVVFVDRIKPSVNIFKKNRSMVFYKEESIFTCEGEPATMTIYTDEKCFGAFKKLYEKARKEYVSGQKSKR